MPPRASSRLFPAVVIAGAALTACAIAVTACSERALELPETSALGPADLKKVDLHQPEQPDFAGADFTCFPCIL